MANYKNFAQINTSAKEEIEIYASPIKRTSIIKSLMVCNRSTTSSYFRAKINSYGENNSGEWLYYNLEIPANDTFQSDVFIVLEPLDKIIIYGNTDNLTVSLFGEII